jgi:hypothetical protein
VRYLPVVLAIAACSDPVPSEAPQFTAGPLALGIQTRQVTISWASDVFAEGLVVLTPTQGAPVSVTVPGGLVHDVVVSGLAPNTSYTAQITITANGESTSASLSVTTLDKAQTNFRVLFDAAHGEDAGNADWVIDEGDRFASPANPNAATDWNGAISSWAFDLFLTGRYEIESLPQGQTISFNTANAQDLSLFDVFVLPEPNRRLSNAERAAVLDFVEQGGGLILVSGHEGADRDNDGFYALQILNELMDPPNNTDPFNPNGVSLFGVEFDDNTISDDPLTNIDDAQGTPVTDGLFGRVGVIGINSGATMTLLPGGQAQAIAWLDGVPRGSTDVIAAVSSFGAGKIFLIGDSAPFDDGTGQSGNLLFDSWNLTSQDNATLFLNATAFVAGDL